jgi:hypothetical protein
MSNLYEAVEKGFEEGNASKINFSVMSLDEAVGLFSELAYRFSV